VAVRNQWSAGCEVAAFGRLRSESGKVLPDISSEGELHRGDMIKAIDDKPVTTIALLR
jgi:hypothetical protein